MYAKEEYHEGINVRRKKQGRALLTDEKEGNRRGVKEVGRKRATEVGSRLRKGIQERRKGKEGCKTPKKRRMNEKG